MNPHLPPLDLIACAIDAGSRRRIGFIRPLPHPPGWRGTAAFALICLLAGVGGLQASGANVNEALAITHRYVDAANNSGIEDGSLGNPWNTITEGLAWLNANGNLNAKLRIANGVYREGGLVLSNRSGVAVIEGESRGGVIISGSDIWTGWTADGSGNWYKTWTHNWGLSSIDYPSDPESDLGRRLEMVFQDGILLRQVLTPGELAEGTYCVDEAADRLYVRPFGGADPGTVTLEVSVRPHLFFMYANDDVVFRNLTFRHAASGKDSSSAARTFIISGAADNGGDLEDPDYSGQPINSPPDRDFAENILIEGCIFEWNNSGGASINNAKYVTIRNSTFRYNGSSGLGASRLQHVEYLDSQFNYNNWRKGVLGGLYGWNPAGTKTLFADQLTIRGCDFIGNQTTGLWMDFGSSSVTVFDTLMTHNWSHGFYNEANYGPVNASALLIRNNGFWPNNDGPSGGGILFAESRAFSVSYSYIIDNAYYGLGYRNSSRLSTAYWSGSTYAEVDTWDGICKEMNFYRNTVVASRSENRSNWTNDAQRNGNAIALDSGGTTGWATESVPTYSGDYNTYYSPHTTTVFTDKQDSSYGWDEVDLAGWRSDTGQDLNSVWDANWQDGLDFDAYQESGGLIVFEAENYHSNVKGSDSAPWQINHGLWSGALGHCGSGYLEPPVNATAGGSASAALTYRIHIQTPGTYYLAVRRLAPTTSDDSVHVYLDGNLVGDSASLLWGAAGRWTWKRAGVALGSLAAGVHELKIVRREDGFGIDRIALANDPAKLPSEGSAAIGPGESPLGRPAQSDNAVTVTAQKTIVKESEGQAVFRFARPGIDGDLTVFYSVGGTAAAGVDYTAPAGTLVITDGSSHADITVPFLDDGVPEEAKTLIISVGSGAGYTIGAPASATVTQPANGLLAFTNVNIAQPTGTTQTFTLQIHNPFSESVTYRFENPSTRADEYGWVPDPYLWTDIAQSGNAVTALDNHDGTNTAQINNLPNGHFRFMGGSSFDRIFISSNGLLTFYFNENFPGANIRMPSQDISQLCIAGFWDDLDTVGGGRIYQAASGDRHIVQFDNVNVKNAGSVTFQIVLDYNSPSTSADDEVVLVYRDVATAGSSHTIAAQSWLPVNGGAYFEFGGPLYAYNESKITSLRAIRLIEMPAWFTSNHGATDLTIPAGQTASLTFTIDTTGLPEGTVVSRTFPVVADRSDIEQTPLSVQLTVGQGAGAVAFVTGGVTVQEDDSTATVQVVRAAGSTGAVSIDYANVDGTALDGTNYTSVSGTLNWADGETGPKSIVVPLIPVAAIEPAKYFTVRLGNPQGGILPPAPLEATVTIEDAALNEAPQIVWQPPAETITVQSLTTPVFLDVGVTDDGIPQPLTYSWEKISGPGTAVFDNAATARTSVTFSAPGAYVLRLSANDGALTDTLEVTVQAGIPALVDPSTALRFHYPLNASSGSLVEDASGNGFSTGIANSNGTWGAGRLNNAYIFSGNDYGFIDGPSFAASDAQGLSASAWVRLDATPGTEFIIAEHRTTGRTWLGVDSSRRLFTRLGGSTTISALGAITVGQWHHVAVTAGGGTVRLYLDGVEVGQLSAAIDTNTAILRLANANSLSTTKAWRGGMDEIRAYTRVLTAYEVRILAGTAVFEGNLVPVASAGAPQSVVAGGSITLAGSATDDRRPDPPSAISYLWEQVGGPAFAVIADASNPNTQVTLPAKGDYRFRLIAGDGDASTAAYVVHSASGDPGNLGAVHTGVSTATLSWNDSIGETTYRVWMRAAGSGEWTLVADGIAANRTTHTINGLTRGRSYEFSVQAMDGTNPRDSSEVGLTLREGFIQQSSSPHLVVIEAENYTSTNGGTSSDSWQPTTSNAGYSGASAVEAGPDNGHNWTTNVPGNAPVLSYNVDFATAGTHYVFIRCREPSINGNAGDSLHVGINGTLPSTGTDISRAGDSNGFTIGAAWVWAGRLSNSSRASVTVPSAGVHTIHVWPREDGIIVDKLILTTDVNYLPSGSEPESAGLPVFASVLEMWRQANFGTISAIGEAADTHDLLGDGMANLMKFALGGTPWTRAASLTPTHAIVPDAGANHFEFTYRRRVGNGSGSSENGFTVDGVTYTMETSPDLSPNTWQTGSAHFEQVGAPVYNGDGTETVTLRLKPPMGVVDRQFLRLRVSQP